MKTKHCKLWVGAFLLFTLALNAQTNKNSSSAASGEKCFNENSKIINLGVGFLGQSYYNYGRYGSYTYHRNPALSISYEQAIAKKVGPGFFGIGAYLGYQSTYYQNNDYYYNKDRYYYKQTWANSFIAARFAYHLDALNFDKGELYFGAVIGVRIQSYKYETNSPDPDKFYYNQYRGSSVYPGYSFFVGGRYYLTNNIGLFGELGYGISYVTLGLSIKF